MPSIVKSGSRGVDFSFARPPAARLLELGYTFVVGYISVPPAGPAKNITKDECDAYLSAGLKVLLVWEMSASRASLGAAYGTLDGLAAAQEAFARGYPGDIPILVADDTNATALNIDRQEAYMRAFAHACTPYPVGIYGDTDILARCAGLWQIGWLPNAWSWSGASRAQAEAKAKALGAHVLQHTGFYVDQTWAVDPNEAIADFPAWGLDPDEGDDYMDIRLLTLTDADAQFLATTTADGRALDCRWADGTPKTQAVVAAHRAAAAGKQTVFEQSGNVAGLANVYLHGPLPQGDSKHVWLGSEFAGLDQISSVDQTARDSAKNANDAVARVGQVVGGIQHGLDIAATATA